MINLFDNGRLSPPNCQSIPSVYSLRLPATEQPNTDTTLENKGNASLLRRSDGQAPVQIGSIAGTNTILWRNNTSNHLHTWTLNSSWAWQGSQGQISLSCQEAWALESSFQIDANKDDIIGRPLTN